MSAYADSQMTRAMQVVAAAQAWVQDVASVASDWASVTDVALIDAVDAFEAPAAHAQHKLCLADAAAEHTDLLAGQLVCSRVAGHSGSSHRYEPVAELITKLAG
jgi:hypothetical protein